MKDKNNREAIVETLTTCIKHMPHKVNLYSYLIAALSLEDFDFAFAAGVKKSQIDELAGLGFIEGNPPS